MEGATAGSDGGQPPGQHIRGRGSTHPHHTTAPTDGPATMEMPD